VSRVLVWSGAVAALALTFRTVIEGDGVGYDAFLHAFFVSHNLDLHSEYSAALAANVPVYLPWLTPDATGRLTDYFPVGPAVLAGPFYLVALALRPSGEPQYGSPFVEAFTLASLAYGMLALALSYRLARRAMGDARAAFAGVIAAVVATPLTYYLLTEPSYSHTFSAFCVAAFLYMWWTGPPSTAPGWLGLGVLGGLMAMTRFQDGLLMLLVLIDWRRLRLPAVAIVPGTLLGFAPQLAVDRVEWGGWLPQPFPGVRLDPLHGHYLDTLVSSHHGLLVWTPAVLVAAAGVFFLRDRRLQLACILGFVIEVAITGAVSDTGGNEFGTRRLLALTPFAVIAFAALASRIGPRFAWAGVAAFGAWNLVLIANQEYVNVWRDPGYQRLIAGQLPAVSYVPRLFAKGTVIRDLALSHQVVPAAVLLALEALLVGVAVWVATRRSRAFPIMGVPQ
jgi:Dolichyl-phosphate-mannose-protein mannosyltransferase